MTSLDHKGLEDDWESYYICSCPPTGREVPQFSRNLWPSVLRHEISLYFVIFIIYWIMANKCITRRKHCISFNIEDNTTSKMCYSEALVKYNILQTPSAKGPQNRNRGHIALGLCALRQVHTFEKMGTAA